MLNKLPLKKIILIVWVAFSILYVAYNEYNRFSMFVMQRSYQQGMADAVGKIIDESKTCKALPINVGDSKANLINVDCLKQQAQPKVDAPK